MVYKVYSYVYHALYSYCGCLADLGIIMYLLLLIFSIICEENHTKYPIDMILSEIKYKSILHLFIQFSDYIPGNLACAHSQTTIQTLGITHILTVDLVPLPRIILERPHLIFRYVKCKCIVKL